MTEEEFMQKSADALKRLTEMDATMDIIRAQLAQPEREWVGLTDEEIDTAVKSCNTVDTYKYFRAIEAKLKEKNNG